MSKTITYSDEKAFHNHMQGDYTLPNVILYIVSMFNVEDIFTEEELVQWAEDNLYFREET